MLRRESIGVFVAAPCQLGMYITTVEHRLLRDDGCATASLPDAPSHPRKFLECRETVKQEHRDIHIGRGKINCRPFRFLRVCARGSTNGSALHRNWHSSIRIAAWAAWALFSLQYFPDTTSESPNPVFYLLTGTKWRTRGRVQPSPGAFGCNNRVQDRHGRSEFEARCARSGPGREGQATA